MKLTATHRKNLATLSGFAFLFNAVWFILTLSSFFAAVCLLSVFGLIPAAFND